MAFPDVLGNFEGYSRSFFITCAAVTILVDAMAACLLVFSKFPRHGPKFNNVILFSLTLADVLYEAATTTLFLQSDSCDVGCENGNKALHSVYLALNYCTVFHLLVEVVEKIMADLGWASHRGFGSRVFWSAAVWMTAFLLAYLDNGSGLIDEDAMAFLGRFKAFGYLLFGVIFTSAILVNLMTFGLAKPLSEKSPLDLSNSLEATRQEELTPAVAHQQDVVFSCMFMATFVGWCAWVVLGVDTRIMKTVEVMKSFEVSRLGARIICPLTMMYSFSHRNEHLVLGEL